MLLLLYIIHPRQIEPTSSEGGNLKGILNSQAVPSQKTSIFRQPNLVASDALTGITTRGGSGSNSNQGATSHSPWTPNGASLLDFV